MKTHRRLRLYVSSSLFALVGTAALCPLFAAEQVVRPDPADMAAVERANETLSSTQAFENLEAKAGDWRVEKKVLVQADRSAPYAKCSRFEVARVAWATGDGFKAGQEMEIIVGYPGVESPTYRVTIATGGQPISALRLQLPTYARIRITT